MTEPRDPLIEAIHAAGEVPPPPGRDAALARAMKPVLVPSRRRWKGSVIALFAAVLLAVPAAVFAARATHTPATIITPITAERPDPGSSIQHEADDSTLKHESTSTGQHTGSQTASEDLSGNSGRGSAEADHSGDGTTVSLTGGRDGSGSDSSGSDSVAATPEPSPIPSPTMGSPEGPSPTGSPEPSDGGSPGPT